MGWLLGCSPAIEREISKSSVFAQNHTGFYLIDPERGKVLADINGSKYFTPASNTKILTFYTSLHVLGDSVPALTYSLKGDSVIVWGTGDPSFLNPDVEQGRVWRFLSSFDSIYYSPSNFYDDFFGPGWAWDDYLYGYQPEKSPFPVYGNRVEITWSDSVLTLSPHYFETQLLRDETREENFFRRSYDSNTIRFNLVTSDSIETRKPFRVSNELMATLLSDTLGSKVTVSDIEKEGMHVQTMYSVHVDSLYVDLMQDSDNFIAEQLMLMNAGVLQDTLKSSIAIDYGRDSLLSNAPDPLVWVDGSGLSRYNLFTPRSIVYVWQQISQLVHKDRLYAILPAGGDSGTLEDWYIADEPYIYGKTGTLSNNHSLSGFLKTKKGKTLIFSFMNSNYRYGSSTIKSEMEQILRQVYEKY